MFCSRSSFSPGGLNIPVSLSSAAAFVVSASAEADRAPCRYPTAGAALPPVLCESSAAGGGAADSESSSIVNELRVAMVKGRQASGSSKAARQTVCGPNANTPSWIRVGVLYRCVGRAFSKLRGVE